MKRTNSTKGAGRAAKFRPIKAWALVVAAHQVAHAGIGNATVYAIFPRRYLAAEAAGADARFTVIPVEIRSLKHRPR